MSDSRDAPEILEHASDLSGKDFFCHDIHTGSFILAKCLSDTKGANVYRFDDLDKDPESAMRKIGELITPQNVHQHLLPWFRSEPIPTHLDSGEYGYLTIVHLPYVTISRVRSLH